MPIIYASMVLKFTKVAKCVCLKIRIVVYKLISTGTLILQLLFRNVVDLIHLKVGFSENETAISTKLCPVGTARSDSFYNEGETKFTVCKDCDWKKGQYGDTEGRTECRNVEDGFVVGKS